jgi:hypothetical protein
MSYVFTFIAGVIVGIFIMALAAASKDDNTNYSINNKN